MTPQRGKELPTMSRKNKKLALKKESLRNLSENELGQVNGGLYADWYIMKQPVSLTSKTDPWPAYNFYFYIGY
jgi:hypothetical protein